MKLFNKQICYLLILFSVTAYSAKEYKIIPGGSWCWFQDERAVIDTTNEKLIVGATDMQARAQVNIFDISSKSGNQKGFNSLGNGKQDDHNSPAVLVAPNGNYICMWAHHYDSKHRYSIYSNGNWSGEKSIEWNQWSGGQQYDITYSNLYYLSDENRIYNFARAFNVKSPHFVYSDDNGEHWKFGGMLTTHDVVDTYNRGYYKYWGNGKDRIDIAFTEEHPRDHTTSIYHGYIKDHKLYDTFGNVVDEDIYDGEDVPSFESFTKVFEHGTDVDGVEMGRCWQADICHYDSITVILLETRADDEIDDHRYFYARFDGDEWNYTYIGKAGKHIYGNEHDYVGLGSVNPNDPNRIYLSTVYNPGDDSEAPSSKREIWRGTSKDEGETWEWEKITSNSQKDNWRPIVPKWKPGKEAVLWFRGDYITAQDVRSDVYGSFFEYEYVPPILTSTRNNRTTNDNASIINPVSLSTTSAHSLNIQVALTEPAAVTVQIFSLSGKRVATVADNQLLSGTTDLSWNTRHISRGAYCAQISIGNRQLTRRVTVQ